MKNTTEKNTSIIRQFTIKQKGIRGKAETPFVTMETNVREKLTLFLDDREDLQTYDIGDQFVIGIGGKTGRQPTLDESLAQAADEHKKSEE